MVDSVVQSSSRQSEHTYNMKSLILIFICALFLGVRAQLEDNFSCPDEFEGFYPHLFSCDLYWKCQEGQASLEKCGNGLAFVDKDPTFTSEECDYLYNVDCGNRTELEPPISALNCPRLYGTFEGKFLFLFSIGCSIWIWDILKSYCGLIFGARHFSLSLL